MNTCAAALNGMAVGINIGALAFLNRSETWFNWLGICICGFCMIYFCILETMPEAAQKR